MAGPRLVILKALKPIQRIAQKLGNPEPKITSRFVDDIMTNIKDGDLLLSREDWKLTNPFVPGFWGHAAIYYNGKIYEAVGDYIDENEKISNGVRAENPYRWLFQKDHVAHLRVAHGSDRDRKAIGIIAASQKGKRYDYLFLPNEETFYCSELFVYSYNKVFFGVHTINNKDKFGVHTSTPQDLYEMRDKLLLLREEIN